MPLDPAALEIIRQLPMSVLVMLALLYLIRTNRQDRHELNAVAIKQADTEQLSAQNQQRLIEKSEVFEATLSGLTARVANQQSILDELRNLNKTLVTATQQNAELSRQIRTRDEAKLQSRDDLEKFTQVVKESTGPIMDGIKIQTGEKDLILRKLETLHESVAALPAELKAITVKIDGFPVAIGDAFKALWADRDAKAQEAAAEREQKEQAQAALATFQKQNADLTGQVMARDTTIAEQAALIADLRAIDAKHKLAEAASLEATGEKSAATVVEPVGSPETTMQPGGLS